MAAVSSVQPIMLKREGWARWTNLYFALIAAMTLLVAVVVVGADRSWSISDWLINYQGGFVRRGLPGEIILMASRTFHISPVALVIATCLILYATILTAVHRIAARSCRDLWSLCLLMSPATLAFHVLDLGAGFRKELLFLSLMGLSIVWLQDHAASMWTSIAMGCAFSLTLLSHEALIVFLPYLWAVLVLTGSGRKRALYLLALPALMGLATFVACAMHPGNLQTVEAICGSLHYPLLIGPDRNQVCAGGAIPYLTHDARYALSEVLTTASRKSYWIGFPALTILALLPVVAGSRALYKQGLREEVNVLWLASGCSALCSLMLFIAGLDWGRWIYIHVFSITMLLLLIDGKANLLRNLSKPKKSLSLSAAILLALYATTWTIPHVFPGPKAGYFSLERNLVHYFSHHKVVHALSLPGTLPKPFARPNV